MKLSYLKKRSVINMYSGNLLGYISDVIVSFPNGNIEALIVKPSLFKRISNIFSLNKIYVNWENIISIGKDVILVNIIDN